MNLSTLKPGTHAVIVSFEQSDAATSSHVTRMMEMGLTVGTEVEVAHEAPFGGAIAVRCRGTLIAIRISDALLVQVRT